MRRILSILILVLSASSAFGAVSVGVGISTPGVSIGINVPAYPRLVAVPGYPVYYAPGLPANYFFFDGLYWVYDGNNWYASSWYNGPWGLVEPYAVPVYLLRVPVRYYRHPPPYFRAWRVDAPPRWGEHWGREWEDRRRGWDHGDRHAAPRPAPLPSYQRQYPVNRYPPPDQQQQLHERNYRYQPREGVARRHDEPAEQRGDRGDRGDRGKERGHQRNERER